MGTSSQPPGVEAGPSSAFPIVGLGASAGGLEALRVLFASLPARPGMAFVVIQHLDPERPSLLTSVLEAVTSLSVVEATDGMRVEPDRVYVIPANADLSIDAGVLGLVPRRKTGGLHLPIDAFFSALARDRQRHAIGVVLSGSGSDGTVGLRAIKVEGGIAIAQSPESAEFRSMPEGAIAAGLVDFCGDPREIAEELVRLGRHPYLLEAAGLAPAAEPDGPPQDEGQVGALIRLVRKHAGIDFTGYKRTTVMRRLARRMALRRVGAVADYVEIVRDSPPEARALAQDVLIHVTSFFRDLEAFDALKRHVLQPLVEQKRDGDDLRIWVPGCSTGEEVYSIAISCLEVMEAQRKDLSIKIFGSDLSEESITTARAGSYADPALTLVSEERLKRFFERAEGAYRIGKRIRDLCVFVKHDLTRDPPFAKLDLISCRNVLIYFDAELQRSVLPMLHACLVSPGYLFLGQSETIAGFRDLFSPVDMEHRLFARTGEPRRLVYPVAWRGTLETEVSRPAVPGRPSPVREALRQADHLLLARFAPPGVVINDRLEIVQFRGRTGAFLEAPPGQPESNVLRLAREELVAHLHEALERAKAQSVTVRKEQLHISTEAGVRPIDLEVVPLTASGAAEERFFLVLFLETARVPGVAPVGLQPPGQPSPRESASSDETRRLRTELVATKDYLQSLIGEHQRTADDLATANEELIASNEELQSTNEELQSAKEELQSTNEELSTLNDELRGRNAELDKVANDLVNVLASVELPVIIVDRARRVRRFTPAVRQIGSLIPEDVGRPIDDLKLRVRVDDLDGEIRDTIERMAPTEREVQGHDGRWFRMQIRPYRTVDHRLEGAVVSFVDVDVLKKTLSEAEGARDYARSIVETVPTALVVLDARLHVRSANHAFYALFDLAPAQAEGHALAPLSASVWEQPPVRLALTGLVDRQEGFLGLEVTAALGHKGRRILSLSGQPIVRAGGTTMVLVALEDITALRALEEERAQILASEQQARREAQEANRAKDLFLATLSHELRTPLSTLLLQAQLLKGMSGADRRLERASDVIQRAVTNQARLIDDLLDVSRIVSGKLLLDLRAVDLKEVVLAALEEAREAAAAKAITLEATVDVATVFGDPSRLQQVVANLLNNAIKFTPRGGRVMVRLERLDGRAQLTVTDTGPGISAEVLPHLFSRFVQADSSVTRTHGGLGLGLAIVRHLVEVHGGEVTAESPGPGRGATFRVTLPLGEAAAGRPAGASTVARDLHGVKVLVVEDEPDARAAMVEILEGLGAEVLGVPSTSAALAALEQFTPHAILSDVAMPGEDGYTFMKKVRRLDPAHGGRVPAAAVTALASIEDRRRALEAGFQLHVAKPIDLATLASVVGRLAAWKWPPDLT